MPRIGAAAVWTVLVVQYVANVPAGLLAGLLPLILWLMLDDVAEYGSGRARAPRPEPTPGERLRLRRQLLAGAVRCRCERVVCVRSARRRRRRVTGDGRRRET